MRRKQPALQGRREPLRFGVKDKSGGKQDNHSDEHVRGVSADAQHTPAEQRDRINHAQAQEDLEEILKRHVTHMDPAITVGNNGNDKAEQIDRVAGFGPAQQRYDKGQHIRGHRAINQ